MTTAALSSSRFYRLNDTVAARAAPGSTDDVVRLWVAPVKQRVNCRTLQGHSRSRKTVFIVEWMLYTCGGRIKGGSSHAAVNRGL